MKFDLYVIYSTCHNYYAATNIQMQKAFYDTVNQKNSVSITEVYPQEPRGYILSLVPSLLEIKKHSLFYLIFNFFLALMIENPCHDHDFLGIINIIDAFVVNQNCFGLFSKTFKCHLVHSIIDIYIDSTFRNGMTNGRSGKLVASWSCV